MFRLTHCRLCLATSLLALGCATVAHRGELPLESVLEREQLVIHSDFAMPSRHRLVEDLVAQRGTVAETLSLPLSDEPIHIYLFDSPDSYRLFVQRKYPDFPDRRAIFVETDTQLSVYAQWGDRVAEDLRHETAHGYLHAVTPNLPLWLDEGLAEYFETPRGEQGFNRPHVAILQQELQGGRWTPDIQRLEQLTSSAALSRRDYAESWLWVYWMLHSEPHRRELLRGYLSRLRSEAVAPPVSLALRQVESRPDLALTAYLDTLPAVGYMRNDPPPDSR
jgi:hypothetical protein